MNEAESMHSFLVPRPTPGEPPHDAEPRTEDTLFDQIAEQVVRRGLVTPAVFFLELHRPLGFLAGQATHVLSPFLGALFGLGNVHRLARLLEDPTSVDRLLERIEQRDRGTACPGTSEAGGSGVVCSDPTDPSDPSDPPAPNPQLPTPGAKRP
jgi:hypothetical protein